MTVERLGFGRGESLIPWIIAPIVGMAAVIVFGTQLPARSCEESTSLFLESAGPRPLLTALGFGVSLLLAIAAAVRFTAVQRQRDIEVPPHPVLWTAGFTCVCGAALIVLAPARSVFFSIGILGFVADFVCLLVLIGAQRRHEGIDGVGHTLTVYLAAAAFGLCPGLTLAALHLSLHPLGCSFS